MSVGGIRITAEDPLTGEGSTCVLRPGAAEPYVLFLAEPLYLHSTRVHGNGTVVLTLMRGQPIERMPEQVTLIDPLSVSKYSSSGDVHVHLFEECPAVRRAIRRDGAVNRRPGTVADFHSPGLYAKPCGWCARSRKLAGNVTPPL